MRLFLEASVQLFVIVADLVVIAYIPQIYCKHGINKTLSPAPSLPVFYLEMRHKHISIAYIIL